MFLVPKTVSIELFELNMGHAAPVRNTREEVLFKPRPCSRLSAQLSGQAMEPRLELPYRFTSESGWRRHLEEEGYVVLAGVWCFF